MGRYVSQVERFGRAPRRRFAPAGAASVLAAAMLALIDASCVAAALEAATSEPSAALAFLAAMTISIASRMVSVSRMLASSNASIRLSPNHSAACPSPRTVFVASCCSGNRSGIHSLTRPPGLALAALSPLTTGHYRVTPLHYFGYQPFPAL